MAGVAYRGKAKESIALKGAKSGKAAVHLADLAEILQAQGRLQDAEKLIKTAIRIKGSANISSVYKMYHRNIGENNYLTSEILGPRGMANFKIKKLEQAAIALSFSTVTGERGDGLLSMEEILNLKLDPDWVVLSACNTGVSEGEGAEAFSGPGRAFFYAGTRVILVSMWPVETTSARKLTTGLFRNQKEDKKLSHARAFRKSILELIDGPGLKDKATDKIVASYAHPFFWAPFIIVGGGG